MGENAPREKEQWMCFTEKNRVLKYNFNLFIIRRPRWKWFRLLCDTCYRSVVCPSVCVRMSSDTLVHPAKAVGRNEMPLGTDTHVVPSNTVLDRGTGLPTGRGYVGVGTPCSHQQCCILPNYVGPCCVIMLLKILFYTTNINPLFTLAET